MQPVVNTFETSTVGRETYSYLESLDQFGPYDDLIAGSWHFLKWQTLTTSTHGSLYSTELESYEVKKWTEPAWLPSFTAIQARDQRVYGVLSVQESYILKQYTGYKRIDWIGVYFSLELDVGAFKVGTLLEVDVSVQWTRRFSVADAEKDANWNVTEQDFSIDCSNFANSAFRLGSAMAVSSLRARTSASEGSSYDRNVIFTAYERIIAVVSKVIAPKLTCKLAFRIGDKTERDTGVSPHEQWVKDPKYAQRSILFNASFLQVAMPVSFSAKPNPV